MAYLIKRRRWYKVEMFEGHVAKDGKTNLNFQHINEPYRISPYEVLQSFLIDTLYNLFISF